MREAILKLIGGAAGLALSLSCFAAAKGPFFWKKAKWPGKIAQAHEESGGGLFAFAEIFPFTGPSGALERLKNKGWAIERMGANCRF